MLSSHGSPITNQDNPMNAENNSDNPQREYEAQVEQFLNANVIPEQDFSVPEDRLAFSEFCTECLNTGLAAKAAAEIWATDAEVIQENSADSESSAQDETRSDFRIKF